MEEKKEGIKLIIEEYNEARDRRVRKLESSLFNSEGRNGEKVIGQLRE